MMFCLGGSSQVRRLHFLVRSFEGKGCGPDSVADLEFVLGVSEWSQVTAMAVWGCFSSCKMSSSRK